MERIGSRRGGCLRRLRSSYFCRLIHSSFRVIIGLIRLVETLGSPPIPVEIEPLDTILDMVEKLLETPQMQLIPDRETYWLYERAPEWRF